MARYDFLKSAEGSVTLLQPAFAALGAMLAERRTEAELTTEELAEQVGAEGSDWVRAVEDGTARIPSVMFRSYARSFGMTTDAFARLCIMHYDPYAFEALFGTFPTGLRAAA